MKKLLTLFFSVVAILTFAQKTISGKITDSDGNPVPSASVTIENPDNPVIIAYGISDAKGVYKISFNTDLSKVNVKVKGYNQKTQTKEVNNQDQTVNFNMTSDVTEIKEVVLKTKLITKKGDTLSFDLKPFTNKNDRVLADALKKIPGIDVASDGSILYQGNPINKFYVNGKDLMEGGYGTVNNSLPLDAIAKVEVMENHQPVKILQDKVPSDAAAINVKLKKAVTMTGRGEVGVGASPFLWNVKLTPMLFSDKIQWLFNYKTNNNGEQVENDGNLLAFGSMYEGVRGNVGQNGWLNVDQAATPSIAAKRYLMNSVHFLSGNLLTNIDKKKEWEFKANANYTNNAVDRESVQETQFTLPNNTNLVSSHTKNHFYTDKVKGEIIFTKNAKKGFFKNTTTFSQFWNANRANVQRSTNGTTDAAANEALESPTTSFQNSLSTIIPWKEKLVNLRSYISYQNDKQNLIVDPASYTTIKFVDPTLIAYANQNYRMKTFNTQEAINMSFSAKKWTFTPEVGINYVNNKLNTDLYGTGIGNYVENLGADYQNNLQFSNTTPYLSGRVNYKGTNLSMYLTFPINFNNIKADDPVAPRNINMNFSKTSFEPNAYLQYEFASFWKATASGAYNYNFGSVSNVYGGYVLLSPTNLMVTSSNGILSQSKTTSGSVGLEYRNPLNNLFFNIRGRVGNTNNNLMTSTQYDQNGSMIAKYIVRDNDMNSNGQSFEIGKYFPKFKTNASVSYSNANSKSLSLNNSLIQRTKNNTQSTSFKFNNAFFSWMSLDYTMTFGWTKGEYTPAVDNPTSKTNSYSHNLNLIFYPIENHSIGLNWDQTNFKQAGTKYDNPFYDITYQYTWAKKKIDFELKWLNIANTKVYQTIGNSSTGTTYRTMYIRPSQFMFTVKFNFK